MADLGLCVFHNRDGFRLLVKASSVEAVQELDNGCTIVTDSDTYRVRESYPEVVGTFWPELFQ